MTTNTFAAEGQALPPALDAGAPYTSRLSARSALYSDLQVLLDAQRVTREASFRSLVVDENRLVRKSIAARKKAWQELKTRYILQPEHPLFAAFLSEWNRCRSEPERGLTAYVLLALNDRLVADLGIRWLFPRLRRAPAEVRIADIRGFIDGATALHPEVAAWSDQTRAAVAQKYAASIRDFGLARGKVNKVTTRPALYGAPVRLLVRVLRLVGISPTEMIQARVFRLLALDGQDVVDALGELNRTNALSFRMQGDVVELEVETRP